MHKHLLSTLDTCRKESNGAVCVLEPMLQTLAFICSASGRSFAAEVDRCVASGSLKLESLPPHWRDHYDLARSAVDGLTLVPISLKAANEHIEAHHRHHLAAQGHKFSIGIRDADGLRGVAVASRPVARHLDDGWSLEITRLATDGVRNGPSMLLGAVRRAAKALGYRRVLTYCLDSEDGISLRAAGYVRVGVRGGGLWSRESRARDDRHPTGAKILWVAVLGDNQPSSTRTMENTNEQNA